MTEIQSRMKGINAVAQSKNWTLEATEDASFLTGVMSFQILFEQYFSS